jgi:hypothetical protein
VSTIFDLGRDRDRYRGSNEKGLASDNYHVRSVCKEDSYFGSRKICCIPVFYWIKFNIGEKVKEKGCLDKPLKRVILMAESGRKNER